MPGSRGLFLHRVMGNVRKWGKISSLHEIRSSRQCVKSRTSFLSGIVFNIILIAYGDTCNQEVRSFSPGDRTGKQPGLSLDLRFFSSG